MRAPLSGRGSSWCVAGVPESPVWGSGGWMRAAAALAFAVALRMRAAGRGGSEDEVEEVDEAEDEGEVVDAGWAVMRAGLWAAASAAATARRIEGMSSGYRLGAGGWGGPVVLGTWIERRVYHRWYRVRRGSCSRASWSRGFCRCAGRLSGRRAE